MRKQYTIFSINWYYALFIFGLTLFWALAMRKAQVVSSVVLQSRNKNQMEILLSDPNDPIARILFYLGLLAVLISFFYILKRNRLYKVFTKIFILYLLLIAASVISTIMASFDEEVGFADLRCDFGVFTVIAYGLVFVGCDKRAWGYILKTLAILAYITSAVIPFIFLNVLGASQDVYRLYFVYFIFALAWIAIAPVYINFGVLSHFPFLVRLLPLLCFTSISFACLSRGWILQSFIMCLLAGWKGRDFLLKHVILVSIILVIGIYVFASSPLIEVFTESYNRFVDRMNDDTRTNQYETFFNQVSVPDFIQGCGLKANYVLGNDIEYAHFDNQFVTMSFKMGLLFVLGYLLLLIFPAFKLFNRVKGPDVYPLIVIYLHLLATLGLSIFYGLKLSFTMIIVALCAGRCWYLLKVNEIRNHEQ